jgi:glycosyltransferase involved in cell wall biosynthesis
MNNPNKLNTKKVEIKELLNSNYKLQQDIAVHIHIYYIDLIDELLVYLNNIPTPFSLYITIISFDFYPIIKGKFQELQNLKKLTIKVVKNIGRDVAPMLVELGPELALHEIVLHIHTKKSPHNSWQLGGWRRYLLEMLLGNPKRVIAILKTFSQDPNLGILFPEVYFPVRALVNNKDDSNNENFEKLLRLHGKDKKEFEKIDTLFIPAGNMFWFRGKAIKSFVKMKLSNDHFELESGQFNGTLAHAIERLFPYFSSEEGLKTKSYFVKFYENRFSSAANIKLLENYFYDNIISSPIIIFDHNIGGGANTYSKGLVLEYTSNKINCLRIYFQEKNWIIEWHGFGDGMRFYSKSLDEIFNLFYRYKITKIYINTIYSAPSRVELLERIIRLKNKKNIEVDLKIHDYHPICPSPHLLDHQQKYCGVPEKFEVCNSCINKLGGWYHSYIAKNERAKTIDEWRAPFRNFIDAVDTITFFDSTSVEILSKAYNFDSSKVRVVPHNHSHLTFTKKIKLSGPLTIGVLGHLTAIKGLDRIKELSLYIRKNNLPIKIVVVGKVVPDDSLTPENLEIISVNGEYENSLLPKIISLKGINMIFASSIIPETFGYTLSEAMSLNIPIVCYDLGAQANRVSKYKHGRVIKLNSSSKDVIENMECLLNETKEGK